MHDESFENEIRKYDDAIRKREELLKRPASDFTLKELQLLLALPPYSVFSRLDSTTYPDEIVKIYERIH